MHHELIIGKLSENYYIINCEINAWKANTYDVILMIFCSRIELFISCILSLTILLLFYRKIYCFDVVYNQIFLSVCLLWIVKSDYRGKIQKSYNLCYIVRDSRAIWLMHHNIGRIHAVNFWLKLKANNR